MFCRISVAFYSNEKWEFCIRHMSYDASDLSIDNLGEFLRSLKAELCVDVELLSQKVRLGCTKDISVAQLLVLAAETASSLATRHPDWAFLAGKILIAELEVRTPGRFSGYVAKEADLLSPELVSFVATHKETIDEAIDDSQNAHFSFFAVRTLQRSYLHPNERLQYLWMRVALALQLPDLGAALQAYSLMSRRCYTHATPTLFNAGYRDGQLASCFLVAMKNNSVEGIFETLKECAIISHHTGGIGIHCSNISAAHAGEHGISSRGIVPMLRVFNNACRFIDQGGNKRPGAISVTLEPWHADILGFLDLKKNHGKDEYRARDLFYALWIPDLFMQKVKNDEYWYLFSPDTAPGLQDLYGRAFEELYAKYVKEGVYLRRISARQVWAAILDSQIETGNPSLLYKDACNSKSNQKNLGTIKSSNLCTEIVEYSSESETAVCNLANLGLPTFVTRESGFDFVKLHEVVKFVINNLNNTIDRSYTPLASCKKGNLKHRPLALGVQGLADVYFILGLPFESVEARRLNERIFETIYHGALEASMELAKAKQCTYGSFDGSPAQKGLLQCDLWGKDIKDDLWNWTGLRDSIAKHGLFNSLLTGVMPTASTSQILGFTESVEPLTSNIFSRRTSSGEFQVVNRYLVDQLEKLGMWSDDIREEIIAANGSVQQLHQLPKSLRDIFKTAWEISMKSVIDQSVDRGPFIDQSQSLNLFQAKPNHRQLTSMHFNAWSRGLKTGIYYLRTLPASSPIPFTVSHEARKRATSDTSSVNSHGPSKKVLCSLSSNHCESCT